MLLTVVGKSVNGRTVTLTATAANKNFPAVNMVQNIDSLLPGTLVEFTLSQVMNGGLAGQVSGLINGTLDLFHSVGYDVKSLTDKYKENQKIKARVIAYLPSADEKKLRLSILPHVLSLSTASFTSSSEKSAVATITAVSPNEALPFGHIIPAAKIQFVEPGIGIFIETGVDGVLAFVHISRLSDSHIDEISPLFGEYKTSTVHQARITGYAHADGIFLASLQPSVLTQRYLQFEDVKIGDVVEDAEVIKLIDSGGILVQISDGIVGHVNELNLSDVKISQPERRFRPGMKVKCRIMSVSPETHRIRLTLKKSIVGAEAEIPSRYEGIKRGQKFVGTIINLVSKGAIIEFFGTVSAFLPLTEMTNAKITDPKEKFSLGQTVSVRVVSVNAEHRKLRVSCKDPKKSPKEKKEDTEKRRKEREETKKKQKSEGQDFSMEDATASAAQDDDAETENNDEAGSDDDRLVINSESSDEEDDEDDDGDDDDEKEEEKTIEPLKVRGFDWNASSLDADLSASENDSDLDSSDDEDVIDLKIKRQRKRKNQIQVDITGELSTKEPESVADFERMLVGNPNSSALWIRYMAFQIQLGEIEKAREIARRALKTINFRDEKEKLNIWVALLNLENSFGTADTLEATYKESCIYMDPEVMSVKMKIIQKQRGG